MCRGCHPPGWEAACYSLQINGSLDLGLTHVFDQNHTAVGETETDGHTLLELYADYHFTLGERELLMFVKGTNLLDEQMRNHLSFLKNFSPQAGRAIRFGVRFTY